MVPTDRNKRILIVDDNNEILDVLVDVFTYEGYEVNSLVKSDDIFNDIAKTAPHLILLDYILNGINGGELCHQIKMNPLTQEIPIILMSAYSRVFNSLGNYGCDAFIAKPFDISEITCCAEQLISRIQIK